MEGNETLLQNRTGPKMSGTAGLPIEGRHEEAERERIWAIVEAHWSRLSIRPTDHGVYFDGIEMPGAPQIRPPEVEIK